MHAIITTEIPGFWMKLQARFILCNETARVLFSLLSFLLGVFFVDSYKKEDLLLVIFFQDKLLCNVQIDDHHFLRSMPML